MYLQCKWKNYVSCIEGWKMEGCILKTFRIVLCQMFRFSAHNVFERIWGIHIYVRGVWIASILHVNFLCKSILKNKQTQLSI